jgi:hypothetical protein
VALIDRDVGVAVAATATVLSPRAREVMRRGAVYGLAGVLKAGDVVYSTARGAARGAQSGVTGHDGSAPRSRASSSRSSASSSRSSASSSRGSGSGSRQARGGGRRSGKTQGAGASS